MKKIFYLFTFVILTSAAFAQMPPDSKPDMELTKKEAELRIQAFQERVNNLEAQLQQLQNQKNTSTQQLDQIQIDIRNCREEILRLIGATQGDVEEFRQRLGVIEGRVRTLQRLSDDELVERQDEVKEVEGLLNELRGNKISVIPEFYNKIIALGRDIRGLYRERRINTYTVGTWAEDRDCLWNIAGKPIIYGDPLLWPKIWYANKDQIRNPDIIFPGQVLTIPPVGPMDPEAKRMERSYYRQKREAAQTETAQPGEQQ